MGHLYAEPVMRKPSVTTLVGLLDKPALLRWANKQGLQGIDIEKERRRTKDAGTSLHEQIRRKDFESPVHAHNFETFMRDKEVLNCEGDIETEWFVGRYDCKLRWRDQTYMVDYKSGGRAYFETCLQLAAYGMAEPCDRYGVVDIPGFFFIDAKVERNRQKYEDILIALSRIYALRWEIENA